MNGTLGKAVTAAGAPVTPYAAPAGILFATASIFLCNTNAPGSTDAVVNIAITSDASPSTQDYIEYGAVIPAGGILERTCMPMSPNDKVVVISTEAGIAVRVAGLEQESA